MTGMVLCVSTLRVSLPSKIADIPRRPRDAIWIASILGGIDNRLIRMLVLNMHQVAGHSRRRRNILCHI
jgi:hypothetical protein